MDKRPRFGDTSHRWRWSWWCWWCWWVIIIIIILIYYYFDIDLKMIMIIANICYTYIYRYTWFVQWNRVTTAKCWCQLRQVLFETVLEGAWMGSDLRNFPAGKQQALALRESVMRGRFWKAWNMKPYGGFLKWWYPTTMGFPTKNDHFGVFWGYHHFRNPHIYDPYIWHFHLLSLTFAVSWFMTCNRTWI